MAASLPNDLDDVIDRMLIDAIGLSDHALICDLCLRGARPETLIAHGKKLTRYLDYHKILMENGANPNILLFEAIEKKQVSFLNDALTAGADINAMKEGGEPKALTPAMIWAHWYFDQGVFECLLQHGADINAKNSFGNTVLGLQIFNLAQAVDYNQSSEVIKLMSLYIEKGADPLAQNNEGLYPLKQLQESTNPKIYDFKGEKEKALRVLIKNVPVLKDRNQTPEKVKPEDLTVDIGTEAARPKVHLKNNPSPDNPQG